MWRQHPMQTSACHYLHLHLTSVISPRASKINPREVLGCYAMGADSHVMVIGVFLMGHVSYLQERIKNWNTN